MPFNIQGPELILILIIALIVIGPGKLPDVGSALGKSIREFRKAATDVKDATSVSAAPAPTAAAPTSAPAAAAPAPAAAPAAMAEATAEAPAPVSGTADVAATDTASGSGA
jgi:TatA/E family protein of Tat protein translocase